MTGIVKRSVAGGLLLLLLVLRPGAAGAAEFWVYKATLRAPLQSATTRNDRDVIEVVRLTSKTIINAVQGQPLKTRVPRNVVLALLVPTSRSLLDARLAIFDRESSSVTMIATLFDVIQLQSDVGRQESVAVGEASVLPMPTSGVPSAEAQLVLAGFTIAGTAKGRFTDDGDSPGLSLKVTNLNARVDRLTPPSGGDFYYANAISNGRLRASGRPLAKVDL